MTDIANRSMHVNGTRAQVATSDASNNPGIRIASLRRRRRKGYDDIPGNPRDEARRDATRGHRGRRPPGPPGPP